MMSTIINKLKTYFTAGLLVILPIILTIFLLEWVLDFIDGVVIPYLPHYIVPENFPGIGMAVGFVLILGVGAIASSIFGKWVVNAGESIITHIPFLRTVYASSKTILSTVLSNKAGSFNQAVLVQYPTKGIWVVGFVTGDTSGDIGRTVNMINDGTKHINVFLPTTPNPTSGMLLIVDKKDIKPLNMSVEDAVQFVITAGLNQTSKKPL